jgi:two-component system NtrC family sensor kinase
MRWRDSRWITAKIAVGLVWSTAAIFAVFSYWNLRLQRREAENMVVESANRITDLIRRSTRYQMLQNDRAALLQMIQDIASERGIDGVRILNQQGRAVFSAGGAGAAGGRVLSVSLGINNEPGCSGAACHAHPAAEKILGTIETRLSLAGVDAQVARQQALLIRFSAAALLLMCAASVALVWLLVYRPVRALISGAEAAQAARAETLASLGKLSATVAHEINNPLFGILTFARLSLKELDGAGVDPVRLRERLSTIERESRRCGEILRNLLTFARQSPPNRELNSLNELAGRAVTLVRHQAELQHVSIETAFDPSSPVFSCDAGQLQQVVLAMLVNALEAMPRGGLIRVETGPEGFSIADNGPGIPPAVMPHIFEPFFSTKENEQRTGLGLAVARTIVEQHGGSIQVESAAGGGTRFHVRLPAAAQAEAAASLKETT